MSDQETTENFWQVWTTFKWPEPKPISYRCYHDDDGIPLFYTMEDLPGTWIEVSKEIYLLSPLSARVIDGNLQIFKPKCTVKKLIPDQTTGTPCDTRDICVVVNADHPMILWMCKEYEIN